MKNYDVVELKENMLEELIRHYSEKIEKGLKYISHQQKTDKGRLDVIMVDSGGALVIAELKVTDDDDMLFQGIDYYDYVSTHIETFARAYEKFNIKPTQQPRLMLIAPSFSISLLNRCKWIEVPISLFTFKCIKLENENEIIPVFVEIIVPEIPQTIEEPKSVDKILEYITDQKVKTTAIDLIHEIESWDKQNILLEPIKYNISMKTMGKVFAYFSPRRQFFGFSTYDLEDEWKWIPIKTDVDVDNIRHLLKDNIDKLKPK